MGHRLLKLEVIVHSRLEVVSPSIIEIRFWTNLSLERVLQNFSSMAKLSKKKKEYEVYGRNII